MMTMIILHMVMMVRWTSIVPVVMLTLTVFVQRIVSPTKLMTGSSLMPLSAAWYPLQSCVSPMVWKVLHLH